MKDAIVVIDRNRHLSHSCNTIYSMPVRMDSYDKRVDNYDSSNNNRQDNETVNYLF